MTEVNSCCTNRCGLVTAIASVIIGIITTVLTITATITVTPAFYWVAFGIAVLFLALSTAQRVNNGRYCLCPVLRYLLAGILGTVFTSLILLGVGFAATSIIGAIITGVLLFFLSLIIISAACIVRCLANCES